MILYMAIVLYAPSLAVSAVSGFTLWGSVISVGVVCTFYTAIGGIKAVLWADSFQVVVMIVSMVAILIRAAIVVGGWDIVWESARRTNRILFTDFRLDPKVRHSVWSLTIGAFFTWVAIYGVNQAQVQKAATCSTLRKAQIAMWLNFPGLCTFMYLGCFLGMFMSAFYEKCDPLKAKLVARSNQILPLFVMDILGDTTGMPGLFIAGLFCGSLSSISSGLNSIATCVLEDIIKTRFKAKIKENEAWILSQLLALAFGLICLGLTFFASKLENVLQAALSLFGIIGGPLLGVFSLGMFFPWANKWGAYTGLFSSITIMLWIGSEAATVKLQRKKAITSIEYCNLSVFSTTTIAEIVTPPGPRVEQEYVVLPIFTMSYLWYSLTAVVACIVIGLAVSFATGATKPTELDGRLICPLFDVLFPFLPEHVRKPLRFGVIHDGKSKKLRRHLYSKNRDRRAPYVKDYDGTVGPKKPIVENNNDESEF